LDIIVGKNVRAFSKLVVMIFMYECVLLYINSSHSMLYCHGIFQWSSGRKTLELIGHDCLNRHRRYNMLSTAVMPYYQ